MFFVNSVLKDLGFVLFKLHFKKVGFPHEHGSWGFVLEPLLLSLLVAYSELGLLLAIASFFLFLNHQPVRIILTKKINKQFFNSALFFFIIYSIIIIIAAYTVFGNVSFEKIFPFFVAIVLMFLFLGIELQNKARKLYAEFIAPISITFIAVSIVLIGGWKPLPTFLFAIVLLARSIPTVLYVNLKIKAFKKKELRKQFFYFVEIFFFSTIAVLILYNHLPKLSLAAVVLLIGRAYYGLTKKGLQESVKKVGIKEFVFGILYVVIVYIGYNFNL